MRIVKISFFAFTALLASCGNFPEETSKENNAPEVIDPVQQEEDVFPEEIEVLSVISGLNVRSTPGKDGVVIDKLTYGQRAIYYGEETDYKEKIIMRGEPRFSSWKKIRFSGSKGRGATDGWVYGGGVSRKNAVYKEIDKSHFRRDLSTVTSEEISKLLGFDVSGKGYSNGFIEYEMPANSSLLKRHGLFEFSGRMKKHLKSEADFTYDLRGEFVHGQLEGPVVKKVKGSDFDYQCTLSFSSGKAIQSIFSGVCLGVEINYETKNPSECSFLALEKTLQL